MCGERYWRICRGGSSGPFFFLCVKVCHHAHIHIHDDDNGGDERVHDPQLSYPLVLSW